MQSPSLFQVGRWGKPLFGLMLLVSSCAAPPPSRTKPADTAQPATAAPAPIAQNLPPGVLYQDDFTNPNTGWPKLAFDNYFIGYHEPNHYHVEIHAPNDKAIVPIPKMKVDDASVQLKVLTEPNNTAQAGDFRYGMVFRRSGSNYYAFTVSPRTKTWFLLKNTPAAVIELQKGSSDAIQGLKTDDVLRVDMRGPAFTLQINDQKVGEVSDSTYLTGEVGLMVETFDSPRVHVHFGMVTVTAPGLSSFAAAALYQDNFTNPTTGWPKLAFDNYFVGYHEPNHYHVEVHAPNDKALVTIPKMKFNDFLADTKIVVEPNNTAKTGDFRYGVIFRRSGNNYYAFTVSPRTKTWYVLKSTPNAVVELKTGASDLIQGLKTDDVLGIDAKGPDFRFSINSQPIGEISDTSYITGEIGFMVETFDSPRAHIHYGGITIAPTP